MRAAWGRREGHGCGLPPRHRIWHPQGKPHQHQHRIGKAFVAQRQMVDLPQGQHRLDGSEKSIANTSRRPHRGNTTPYSKPRVVGLRIRYVSWHLNGGGQDDSAMTGSLADGFFVESAAQSFFFQQSTIHATKPQPLITDLRTYGIFRMLRIPDTEREPWVPPSSQEGG